jgi:F420-dependent oxidoreductase-like protein
MNIGLMISTHQTDSLADAVDQIGRVADAGLHTAWLSQVYGLDALTVIAVAAAQVPGIEMGTAVVPTYPRHPIALAGQALTTQAATGGRLVLGVGPSHQMAMEGMMGIPYERPARHTREYVTVLRALATEGTVDLDGETIQAHTAMGPRPVTDAPPLPILISALAPAMVKVAGEVADGTITWMAGPATLGKRIVPSLTEAAEAAGRPAPRVVAGLPIAITTDPAGVREKTARQLAVYGMLPAYRRLLDEEGLDGPEDLAIVGDADTVSAALNELADVGVTDLIAAPAGSAADRAATLEFLGSFARRS